MRNQNPEFRTEAFKDRITFSGKNNLDIVIELTPFCDYHLTRDKQLKNEGYQLIKSALAA